MIYVATNTFSVYENFGIEYYLATELDLHDTVFMLWRTAPTLMLGKYQVVQAEINMEYAREQNLSLVRRMSGGGTIFTDLGAFQYTYISRDGSADISFSEYMSPVVSALCALGVPAVVSGRNDITIEGKKVSGNAQYKIGSSTVHHGSLLFCTDLEMLVRSISPSDEKIISKGIKSVRERVVNISDFLSGYSAERFEKYLIDYIVGSGATEYVLTDFDRLRAKELGNEHFAKKECIYSASPKFSVTREKRYSGGIIRVSYDSVHGKIARISLEGDVFSSVDLNEIGNALVDVLLCVDNIRDALISAGFESSIMGVSATELAELIAQ